MNRDRKGSYTGNGSKVSEFLIRKNHHQVVQARQCPAEQVHSQDIFYFHIEYAEFQEILMMYDDRFNKYGSCL